MTITEFPMLTRLLLEGVTVAEGDDPCWEWDGWRRKGYARIKITGKTYSVHRLIYQDIHGSIADDAVVMHTCDNPPCVRPSHLKAGTQTQNLQDMHSKGRGTKPPANKFLGKNNANSKMTVEVVKEVRRRYAEGGVSQGQLAKEFKVNQSNISRAIHGEYWAYVDAVDEACGSDSEG